MPRPPQVYLVCYDIADPARLRLVYRMNMDMMKTPFPPPLAPSIAEQQVRTWVEVFAHEMDKRMDNRMERRKAN